jgi:hypothetical protein
MYLPDTNALSELLKKHPQPQFLTPLRRHPPEATILDFSVSEAVVAGDILAHMARRPWPLL